MENKHEALSRDYSFCVVMYSDNAISVIEGFTIKCRKTEMVRPVYRYPNIL